MNELYIPPQRLNRNPINGRFLKGSIPHNKGKKWDDYIPLHKRESMIKGLALGRTGNPNIAGCNAKKVQRRTGALPSMDCGTPTPPKSTHPSLMAA